MEQTEFTIQPVSVVHIFLPDGKKFALSGARDLDFRLVQIGEGKRKYRVVNNSWDEVSVVSIVD